MHFISSSSIQPSLAIGIFWLSQSWLHTYLGGGHFRHILHKRKRLFTVRLTPWPDLWKCWSFFIWIWFFETQNFTSLWRGWKYMFMYICALFIDFLIGFDWRDDTIIRARSIFADNILTGSIKGQKGSSSESFFGEAVLSTYIIESCINMYVSTCVAQ